MASPNKNAGLLITIIPTIPTMQVTNLLPDNYSPSKILAAN